MSKLVTIYGGSGFVGRYIARRMAREDISRAPIQRVHPVADAHRRAWPKGI